MDKIYSFSLKFDNENETINKKNGLTIRELSELLRDMNSFLEPNEDEHITVADISENCYMPIINTNSSHLYKRAIDSHRRIHDLNLSDLNKKEKKYAKTLQSLLIKGSKKVTILDNEGATIVSITPQNIIQEIKSYYLIKNVYGIITEIGGPKLEGGKTHIDVDGVSYKIYTNNVQDAQLKYSYRSNRVKLKVKQKISIETKKVIHATLLDFKNLSSGSLLENLSQLNKDDLSFLSEFNRTDKDFLI